MLIQFPQQSGGDCDVSTQARDARRTVYEFSIEDHVPQDHLRHSIDRFVDLSGIRQHLAPFLATQAALRLLGNGPVTL